MILISHLRFFKSFTSEKLEDKQLERVFLFMHLQSLLKEKVTRYVGSSIYSVIWFHLRKFLIKIFFLLFPFSPVRRITKKIVKYSWMGDNSHTIQLQCDCIPVSFEFCYIIIGLITLSERLNSVQHFSIFFLQMAAAAWFRNVKVEVGKDQTKRFILDDVTLTVPEKGIMGLIGPSGCGKTSLLRTLMGILPKKSGEIFLGGYWNENIGELSPSYLGYMPQDNGLNDMWKGIDMLRFAGRVFNIKQSEIDKRIDSLRDKIDLPQDLGYISLMSGGQKRRLSLALALIHRPKLLILDEPTVGSDPLCRVKIWKYLEECRDRFGMTIIITTHYIEEVNQADSIAYMYRGHIMCHEGLTDILRLYEANCLEEAVREICQKYRQARRNKIQEESGRDTFGQLSPVGPHTSQSVSQFKIFWASFIRISKEWWFSLSSAILLSAWFCFLIFAIANYLWRAPREIPVCLFGIGSDEIMSSHVVQEFIDKMNSSSLLDLKSCASSIDASYDEKISNFITIDTGFEENLYRMAYNVEYEGDTSPLLKYYGHSANAIEAQIIQNFLQNSIIDEIVTISSTNSTKSSHWLRILHVEPIDGRGVEDNDRRIYSHLLSIYFIFFNFMYGQAFGSFALALDREGNFPERQKIMGIKSGPLLLAHFFRVNTQQILILDLAGIILCLACGYELDIIILKFIGASHFLAACGFCVGCFLATRISSVSSLLSAVIAYDCSQIWLNDVIWPVTSIPYFMRPLTLMFPYQEAMKSAQRVLVGLEGAGINQFLIPSIWIILLLFFSCHSLK